MDTEAVRQEAGRLRREGRFAEALPLYRALWAQQSNRSPWDGWGAAYCLRKLGQPGEAGRYCREAEAYDPAFTPAYSLHGWCLYDAYLRDPGKHSAQTLLRVLGAVAECAARDDPYGTYSPLVRSVLRAVQIFADPYQPEYILQALRHLDPAQLSAELERVEAGGRMRTLPSQRERYYLACTKALEKTKRWRECTDACVKALERIPRYSGSGQLWIQRRLGLSLLEQGDFQHAAALIRRLLAHLDNWFLLDDLAKVEIELGQLAEAREHLRQALGRVGEIRMKVTTLRRMAQVCEKLGDVESACLHSRLAAAIRAEQGWSADPELDALARRLSCEAPPPAAAGLIAEALPLWQSGLPAGAAGGGRELGVVTSLLPSGKAGFIRPASGGPDLYFRTADVNEERTVLPGAEVTFKVTTGFDHKKQRATLNAVNIVMER